MMGSMFAGARQGTAGDEEAFGKAYELPNKTAYNETCAAIANIMWNHRMNLLHGDAKYADVLELVLGQTAREQRRFAAEVMIVISQLPTIGVPCHEPTTGMLL